MMPSSLAALLELLDLETGEEAPEGEIEVANLTDVGGPSLHGHTLESLAEGGDGGGGADPRRHLVSVGESLLDLLVVVEGEAGITERIEELLEVGAVQEVLEVVEVIMQGQIKIIVQELIMDMVM